MPTLLRTVPFPLLPFLSSFAPCPTHSGKSMRPVHAWPDHGLLAIHHAATLLLDSPSPSAPPAQGPIIFICKHFMAGDVLPRKIGSLTFVSFMTIIIQIENREWVCMCLSGLSMRKLLRVFLLVLLSETVTSVKSCINESCFCKSAPSRFPFATIVSLIVLFPFVGII